MPHLTAVRYFVGAVTPELFEDGDGLARSFTETGFELALAQGSAQLEIRPCRYGPGCWMDPHTERTERKVPTHVVVVRV